MIVTQYTTTDSTPHNVAGPWTLSFEQDGTGETARIRDACGNELARSRHIGEPKVTGPSLQTRATMHLMAAAPELRGALEYLLEQAVDMDLKHGIALSEGEQDARDRSRAALASAACFEGEKQFRVEIVTRVREVFLVSAASAEEAEENWWDGRLIDTHDDLECEFLSTTEVHP